MTSFSGSIAYLEYQSRTQKGGVNHGRMLNSVFSMGEMDDARQNFTAETIIDGVTGLYINKQIDRVIFII